MFPPRKLLVKLGYSLYEATKLSSHGLCTLPKTVTGSVGCSCACSQLLCRRSSSSSSEPEKLRYQSTNQQSSWGTVMQLCSPRGLPLHSFSSKGNLSSHRYIQTIIGISSGIPRPLKPLCIELQSHNLPICAAVLIVCYNIMLQHPLTALFKSGRCRVYYYNPSSLAHRFDSSTLCNISLCSMIRAFKIFFALNFWPGSAGRMHVRALGLCNGSNEAVHSTKLREAFLGKEKRVYPFPPRKTARSLAKRQSQ